MQPHISSTVLDVLRRSVVTDRSVTLPPGQLDRATYTDVDRVLQAVGGKWNRKSRSHVFDKDPRKEIETITARGMVEVHKVVTRKKTLQAFYTPAAVADRLVQVAADLFEGGPHFYNPRILEPSAGEGAIVKATRRRFQKAFISAVEIDSPLGGGRASALLNLGADITYVGVDFLTTTPGGLGTFDAVIMNPPFTRGQDVTHVLHAWEFVRPGGVLVAIVSPAYKFRDTRASRSFKNGAANDPMRARPLTNWEKFRRINTDRQLRGGVEIDLPAGTFKESGTNVATVIVGWVKP